MDLISRQAAIKAIEDVDLLIYEGNAAVGARYWLRKEEAIDILNALPSAEKHGKWLLHEYPDGYYHTECSECGKVYSENVYFLRKPNYCPNCGSFMGAKNERNSQEHEDAAELL